MKDDFQDDATKFGALSLQLRKIFVDLLLYSPRQFECNNTASKLVWNEKKNSKQKNTCDCLSTNPVVFSQYKDQISLTSHWPVYAVVNANGHMVGWVDSRDKVGLSDDSLCIEKH